MKQFLKKPLGLAIAVLMQNQVVSGTYVLTPLPVSFDVKRNLFSCARKQIIFYKKLFVGFFTLPLFFSLRDTVGGEI